MRRKLNGEPYAINLNFYARETIRICALPGETERATIERLLVAILPVAGDFETFFGPQEPNVEETVSA